MKYLRGGTERTCLSGGDKSVDIIQISIVEYQAFLVEEIPHSLLFVSLPLMSPGDRTSGAGFEIPLTPTLDTMKLCQGWGAQDGIAALGASLSQG